MTVLPHVAGLQSVAPVERIGAAYFCMGLFAAGRLFRTGSLERQGFPRSIVALGQFEFDYSDGPVTPGHPEMVRAQLWRSWVRAALQEIADHAVAELIGWR